MIKSSTPYYLLAGESSTEIPGSSTLKDVGGKVIVGKYYVVHRNKDGERYPWVVYEKTPLAFTPAAPGQKTSEDGFDHVEIDTFSQYRDAVRAAKKLDREHLASQKTGDDETKAA
jgi:hypothetical protein